MALWYASDIFGESRKQLLESLHQMLDLSCKTCPYWIINMQYCSRRLSIAYPHWLNLWQFEWFRGSSVPKKTVKRWVLYTRPPAALILFFAQDALCDLKHCLHQGGVQCASFASLSCEGTCNALRLSQQILPRWDGKKERRSQLSILTPCSAAKADSRNESGFFTSR